MTSGTSPPQFGPHRRIIANSEKSLQTFLIIGNDQSIEGVLGGNVPDVIIQLVERQQFKANQNRKRGLRCSSDQYTMISLLYPLTTLQEKMKLEVKLNTPIDIFCREYKIIIFDSFDYAWLPPGNLPRSGKDVKFATHTSRQITAQAALARPYQPSARSGQNPLLHKVTHRAPLSRAMYCVVYHYPRIYLYTWLGCEIRRGLSLQ